MMCHPKEEATGLEISPGVLNAKAAFSNLGALNFPLVKGFSLPPETPEFLSSENCLAKSSNFCP